MFDSMSQGKKGRPYKKIMALYNILTLHWTSNLVTPCHPSRNALSQQYISDGKALKK